MTDSPLERRLRMVLAVGEHEAATGRPLGVVQLAELIGREKTQVSRGLRALQAAHLLERDPATLGFRLGPRVFELAAAAGDPPLLHAARPALAALVQQVGERAYVAVLHRSEALTVESASGDSALQAAGGVGRAAPAENTCAGRALLLDRDPCELPPALRAGQEQARAAGYVRSDDEPEPGLLGLAVPVRDAAGAIVAALAVSAPSERLAGRVETVAALLRDAADAIAAALAGSGSAAR